MEQHDTKHEARTAARAGRRPSRHTWLAGLVVAGFTLFGALDPAFGFGDRKPDDTPPGPLVNFGDETIGTLPILHGPDVIELHRNLRIQQPSLCLEGDLATIQNSIAFTRGDVTAQIETVDARAGIVRLVFPGDVQIGFDRLMIESSTIRVGVWTPGRASGVEVVWNARRGLVGASGPFSELPILSMSHAGALSYAPLFLLAHGPASSTTLVASTNQDFLILRQTH